MKKLITCLLMSLLLIPAIAMAEELPVEPVTWDYLLTIAGCAGMTVLIVQLLKLPLDRVWKIPTQIVVFFISFVIMILATYFTGGLTWSNALLTVFNAVIAALTAIGIHQTVVSKFENK